MTLQRKSQTNKKENPIYKGYVVDIVHLSLDSLQHLRSLSPLELIRFIVMMGGAIKKVFRYLFNYISSVKCVWESQASIGREVGYCRTWTQELIDVLEDIGFLSLDRRASRYTHCYFLGDMIKAPTVYAFLKLYFGGKSAHSMSSIFAAGQLPAQLNLIITSKHQKRDKERSIFQSFPPKTRGSLSAAALAKEDSPRSWRMWDDDIARQTKGRYSLQEFITFMEHVGKYS